MVEIERKFLVKEIPQNIVSYKKYHIEQAYLSFNPEVRIRSTESLYFLTVKGDGTLSREEYETSISRETYFELLQKIKGKLIAKERYIIPLDDKLNAELDVYSFEEIGNIVEVEFNDEKEAYDMIIPPWFGEEVTNDKVYKNKNLAFILGT